MYKLHQTTTHRHGQHVQLWMLPCYLESPLCPQCFVRALPTPHDETASLQTNLKCSKCSTFQASRRPLNFKNWSGKIWSHLPEWICFSKWMAYGRCLSWKQQSRPKTAVIHRPNPFKRLVITSLLWKFSQKRVHFAPNQCCLGACAAKQGKQQTQTPSHFDRHLPTARTARTFLAGPTFEPQNPRNNISHIGVA